MFTEERKAIHYGKVEIIRGVICDGYVLNNGTAVLSERGAADLLEIYHSTLQSIVSNWPPKMLEPFIDKDFSMAENSPSGTANSFGDKDFSMAENSPSEIPKLSSGMGVAWVRVTAENSPYKGREILIYTAEMIETLIFAYALALAHGVLRKDQIHIGKRCIILMRALVRTALDAVIREACGLPLHIQQTLQKQHIDAVEILRTAGFTGSVENQIATKKDIINFLGVPMGTLNSFLRKHPEIEPVLLTREQIRTLGSFVAKMYGYSLNDVAKMAFSMNTVPGIQLKTRLFGELSCFVTPETSIEVNWQAHLMDAFAGFGLVRNYVLGPYRLDFLIEILGVALECNGREHAHYDAEKEKAREAFITQKYALVRFQHRIRWEKLMNAILRVKPGEIIRLTS